MGSVPEAENVPAGEPEGEPETGAWSSAVSRAVTATLAASSNFSTSPEPEPEAGVAEPVPEWSVAVPLWAGAWDFHIYGLAAVFSVLALVSFVLLIMIALRRLQAARQVTPILAFLTLLGATRAIFLFGDAYGWRSSYPQVFLQLMYGATLPCLTSAYALLLFSVFRALHPTHAMSKGRSLAKLTVAIVIHFIISITADVIVGLKNNTDVARILVIICYGVFILWGLALFLLFSVAGWTLRRQLLTGHRLAAYGTKEKSASTKTPPGQKGKSVWSRHFRPVVIIGCATICGLAVVVTYVYGMVVTFDTFSREATFPEPWPWWAYQTVSRILEIIMSWLILYATVLTPSNQQTFRQSIRRSSQKLSKRMHSFSKLSSCVGPSTKFDGCPAAVPTEPSSSPAGGSGQNLRSSSTSSGSPNMSSMDDALVREAISSTGAAAHQVCVVMDGNDLENSIAAPEVCTHI